jgi:hypothetical protein
MGSGGAFVCDVAAWSSVCRDLVDGGAGAGLVDDGFAVGVGRDEGLDREVVDGSGQATAGGVDELDRVVAEQGVGASCEVEVVALMTNSSLAP